MMKKTYDKWLAYGQSKLANVLMVAELDSRLADEEVKKRGRCGVKKPRVHAFSLHPGIIKTELGRDLGFGYDVYHALHPKTKTVPQGAATTVYCCLMNGLEEEGKTGRYYSDCAVYTPSPQAQDMKAAAKLWAESLRMCGLPADADVDAGSSSGGAVAPAAAPAEGAAPAPPAAVEGKAKDGPEPEKGGSSEAQGAEAGASAPASSEASAAAESASAAPVAEG